MTAEGISLPFGRDTGEFCALIYVRLTGERLGHWANQSLNERVLDLLADIMFAADLAFEMVELEPGFEPFEGFNDGLRRIYDDAHQIMRQLGPENRS